MLYAAEPTPATAALVPGPGLESLDRAAADTAAASLSPATWKAYLRGWDRCLDWLLDAGLPADLPLDPENIRRFLQWRISQGCSPATLSLDRAAIVAAHRDRGILRERNPANDPRVREVLAGHVKRGRAQRQSEGLLRDVVVRLVAALDAEPPRKSRRGRPETALARGRRITLDTAMLWLMRDAALRVSELVELCWGDVQQNFATGSWFVAVSRSKQRGESTVDYPAITETAADAVIAARLAWGEPLDEAYIFSSPQRKQGGGAPGEPLSGMQIGRRLRAAVRAYNAQLSPGQERQRLPERGFTPHSGRIGLARDMSARGAPDTVIARQAGWRDLRMVARYTRREHAAAALRWME